MLEAMLKKIRKKPKAEPVIEPKLRPADIHDILPITLMWAKMTEEVFDKFIKLDKTELDNFAFAMTDRLRMSHIFTQVIENDRKIIGFVHAYIQEKPYGKPRRTVFCECLYIEKKYRGKGFKDQLLKSLFGWAKENDLETEFMAPFDIGLTKAWSKKGFKPYAMVLRRS